MPRPGSVAYTSQHIGNRIGHSHRTLRPLPAGLDQPRNMPLARMITQTEPAHTEAPIKRPRPTQRGHRLYSRTLNLFGRSALIRRHVLANGNPPHGSTDKRHTQQLEQSPTFLVRLRIGDERDGHPSCFLDLVRLDLRKNNLLAQAERIIAAAIEGPIRDSLEIANSRQCDMNQSVEKLVHALLPQSDHATNRNPFAQLEVSDGLFSARHYRLLSGDGGDLGYGGIENLDILRGLSESDIHGNFFQPRHLHGVLVAELLHHRRHHFVSILLLQSRHSIPT